MNISSFLKLVEIKTKIASMIPLVVGTLIALKMYGRLDYQNLILMILSLLSVDMMTTALNNYMDHQKAISREGFGYAKHNAIERDALSISDVRRTIIFLFCLATLFGILLVIRTDVWVLMMGVLAFIIGISYTFGPFPISRMPLGEVVSGVTMGFGIMFISVYIQTPSPDWFILSVEGRHLVFSLAWWEVLHLILLSVPLVIGIGNIMLANNLCDMEEDYLNHRFTLPISVGQTWGIRLFILSNGLVYLWVIVMVIMKWIPISAFVMLLTAPLVVRNVKTFAAVQDKEKTFDKAVINFILIGVSYIIVWILA